MKSTKSMKKYYIVLVILAILSLVANVAIAQVVREGNTFSNVKTSNKKETKTEFTWKDSKGKEYPIYISSSGSCYILRVSKKTNKEYKQYLGKEVSVEICKILGKTYKSK